LALLAWCFADPEDVSLLLLFVEEAEEDVVPEVEVLPETLAFPVVKDEEELPDVLPDVGELPDVWEL
jgi:hypothetical protein